jgi:hypothetical protein
MNRSESSLPGSPEWMDRLLACTDLLALPLAVPASRLLRMLPQRSSLQKLMERALVACAGSRCGGRP